MKEPSHEFLIGEYKAAQRSVEFHNRTAWTVGSIFIVFSVAGLGVVATNWEKLTTCAEGVLAVASAGLFSVLVLHFWYRIYRRWAYYNHLTHWRQQEIEQRLGLHLGRDIAAVDGFMNGRTLSKAEDSRVKAFRDWYLKVHRRDFRSEPYFNTRVRASVRALLLVFYNTWTLLAVLVLWRWASKNAPRPVVLLVAALLGIVALMAAGQFFCWFRSELRRWREWQSYARPKRDSLELPNEAESSS